MQQDIRTLKQISRVEIIALRVWQVRCEVGSTHPWEPFDRNAPPL